MLNEKISIIFLGSVNEQIQKLKARVEVTFSNFQRDMGPLQLKFCNCLGTFVVWKILKSFTKSGYGKTLNF